MSRPYVSIDIKTTGLDNSYCQVIEFGAVIDDWESALEDLARFHCYIFHERIQGEPFALAMNAAILKKIAAATDAMRDDRAYNGVFFDGALFLRPKQLCSHFADFLAEHGIRRGPAVLATGKNFAGFDRPFLDKLPDWNIPFHRRVIDPAMLFWNRLTDDEPPSTKTCMERAGIAGEVAHTAAEDAVGVVKMVRFGTAEKERLQIPRAPELLTVGDIVVHGGDPATSAKAVVAALRAEQRKTKDSAKEVATQLAEHFRKNGKFDVQRKLPRSLRLMLLAILALIFSAAAWASSVNRPASKPDAQRSGGVSDAVIVTPQRAESLPSEAPETDALASFEDTTSEPLPDPLGEASPIAEPTLEITPTRYSTPYQQPARRGIFRRGRR